MTQEQIDTKISELAQTQALHRNEIKKAKEEILRLNKIAKELDDPYAVIPKSYETIEEWIEGHPFPERVNAMRCKNKREAESVKISCNTYYHDYHIVKC